MTWLAWSGGVALSLGVGVSLYVIGLARGYQLGRKYKDRSW